MSESCRNTLEQSGVLVEAHTGSAILGRWLPCTTKAVSRDPLGYGAQKMAIVETERCQVSDIVVSPSMSHGRGGIGR